MVRRLAALLGAGPTLRLLSQLLEDEEDLPFASAMVQALNLILLTVPEVSPRPLSDSLTFRFLSSPTSAVMGGYNNALAMVQALKLILLTMPEALPHETDVTLQSYLPVVPCVGQRQ